jgi:hypothetical protein
MNRSVHLPAFLLPAACAALLGTASGAACAIASAPPPQSVTVQVDRYIYDDWSSADVERLAITLRATRPDSVLLMACGAEAHRALLQAAQRLNDLPLQLQALPAGAPGCARDGGFAAADQRGAARVEDAATARYWQQVMP